MDFDAMSNNVLLASPRLAEYAEVSLFILPGDGALNRALLVQQDMRAQSSVSTGEGLLAEQFTAQELVAGFLPFEEREMYYCIRQNKNAVRLNLSPPSVTDTIHKIQVGLTGKKLLRCWVMNILYRLNLHPLLWL